MKRSKCDGDGENEKKEHEKKWQSCVCVFASYFVCVCVFYMCVFRFSLSIWYGYIKERGGGRGGKTPSSLLRYFNYGSVGFYGTW